jgi:phosphomannomutase
VQEVYDIVGAFAVERDDLHVTEAQKQAIINACKSGTYKKFGAYSIQGSENFDGFKFRLGGDNWVMIRPSGTEPVLRVYAQAEHLGQCREILDATKATILKS